MERTFRHRCVTAVFLALSLATATLGPPPASAGNKTRSTAPPIDPNAPEIVSPGDIPDNIAFIPFTPTGAGYTVTTPEGWSRRDLTNGAAFTDKYNIVKVERSTGQTAPTIAAVTAALRATFARTKGFRLVTVTTVKRRAGSALLATFSVPSAPNEVTGKSITVSVERYEFHRNGTSVVLTLSGAKGADNVDPWRIITNSFAWK
jgi:hypothetical protein